MNNVTCFDLLAVVSVLIQVSPFQIAPKCSLINASCIQTNFEKKEIFFNHMPGL